MFNRYQMHSFGRTLYWLRSNKHLSLVAWMLLLVTLLTLTSCGIPVSSAKAVMGKNNSTSSGQVTTSPIASTGCGKPSFVIPGTSASETLFSGGIPRSYLLFIPKDYQDTIAHVLVLNFHGHGSNALQQASRTDFSTLANAHSVIVAYPQGVVGPDHHTGWATGPRWNPQVNDVLFTSDLLNYLQKTLCINPQRIYATGFSNGGGMTNMLACKLAGRIAAFASVSGAYPAMPGGCHPVRPVPIVEFHGTADPIVPYNGAPWKGYPSVSSWLQQWVQRDGCKPTPTIFFHIANVIGEKWTGCRDDVTLVHYRISGMGHMWPKHLMIRTKRSTTMFDATQLIWSFFQQYPLPAPHSTMSTPAPYTAEHKNML